MGLHFLEDFYQNHAIGEGTQVIISLVFIFLVAFLFTRITKKLRLPNVTAYILAGVFIGPYVLNLVPNTMIPITTASGDKLEVYDILGHMSFVTDIGLGFIAFGSSRYFNLKVLKKNGWKPACIALIQAILTSLAVFLVLLPFGLPIPIVLVIASIGGTTSSASTLMTIREYHCEGEFVNYTIELDAIDNVFGLFSFSVCSGIALGIMTAEQGGESFSQWSTIWLPVIVNAGIIIIGFLVGWFMAKVAISPTRSRDNRLILMVAAILLLVGLCGIAKVISPNIMASPLLCVMVMGATYLNFSNDDEMFTQVSDFSAPIILLFFVLSGMRFQISYLATVGVIGIVYFFVRLIVKYLSNFLGGLITKSPKVITKYIGLSTAPQAGISIGLAALALTMFSNIKGNYGEQINAIIIFSGILYEIVGPALAKLSLKLSGVLKEENRTKVKKGSELPMVISTESSLRDFVEIKAPTPEMIQKLNNLNKMKEQCDVMDRYVHTKAYIQEDTTPISKT